MQYHHLPEAIKGQSYESRAHWAVAPALGTAIVFLHGFAGEAVNTWTEFPQLLGNDVRARGVDLIFYGYDGMYAQAGDSALRLAEFLDCLLNRPKEILPAFLHRPFDFKFNKVVIAAHSLGAVIARRALLDAWNYGERWPLLTRLVLFAPAHNGAYSAILASTFLNGQGWFLGKLIGTAVAHSTPLLVDLQPQSVVLNQLRSDTEELLAASPGSPFAIAHSVSWATNEKVVINARFVQDPKPHQLKGDHRAVCKPCQGFDAPVDLVLAAL
jgi:pimeloyl-ACP methyl ester carboxylesterase